MQIQFVGSAVFIILGVLLLLPLLPGMTETFSGLLGRPVSTQNWKPITKVVVGVLGTLCLVLGILATLSGTLAFPNLSNQATESVRLNPTPTGTSSPNSTTPIAYYAVFAVQFPKGAWKEGVTYSYFMEAEECGKDNFTGDTFSFSVSRGFAVLPFYLLRDGVYDDPDRNIAKPAIASQSAESSAVVLLPKSEAQEAVQVLSSCKAYLNVTGAPRILLPPNPQVVVGSFNRVVLDPSLFPFQKPSP